MRYELINDHIKIKDIISTQVAVMCLLLPVDAWQREPRKAKATRLQSFYRMEDDQCYGNLLQIHFDGGKTQAKCDGTSKKSLTTSKSQKKLNHPQCILECYFISKLVRAL